MASIYAKNNILYVSWWDHYENRAQEQIVKNKGHSSK